MAKQKLFDETKDRIVKDLGEVDLGYGKEVSVKIHKYNNGEPKFNIAKFHRGSPIGWGWLGFDEAQEIARRILSVTKDELE